jgi:ribosomal protein S18 acetylase RimI-like enzyme
MSIRPMRAADIPTVAALAGRIWRAHYPGIISVAQIEYMLAQRYAPPLMAAELADPGIDWRLAVCGGAVVGFASTRRSGATEMKLDKLYVEPSLQRRGIGRALVAAAVARARELGCTTLSLAVNRHNVQAIAAYRRLGFALRCESKTAIGGGFVMDDFIMAMAIDAA